MVVDIQHSSYKVLWKSKKGNKSWKITHPTNARAFRTGYLIVVTRKLHALYKKKSRQFLYCRFGRRSKFVRQADLISSNRLLDNTYAVEGYVLSRFVPIFCNQGAHWSLFAPCRTKTGAAMMLGWMMALALG